MNRSRGGGVSSGSNARPPGLEEVVVEEAAEHEHDDAVQHHQADLHQGVQRVQISCNFYNLKNVRTRKREETKEKIIEKVLKRQERVQAKKCRA